MVLNTPPCHLGVTSIEKIPNVKFQLLAEIFKTSLKKGPTDENIGILYLIVIIKFGFSEISNPLPPYFIRKPNLTDFYN